MARLSNLAMTFGSGDRYNLLLTAGIVALIRLRAQDIGFWREQWRPGVT